MLKASALLGTPEDKLQLGLGVELGVMPPYLYALWSIRPASEGASLAAVETARILRSVLYEEMLHAALVANVINALGHTPDLTTHLISYPGPLPQHVETGPYAYTVFLGPLSAKTVDLFTKIENPYWPKVEDEAATWTTIRDLYEQIVEELKASNPTFDPVRQVRPADSPGPGRMLPVSSLETACEAVGIILDQGEGLDPRRRPGAAAMDDQDHEVAHYYQFRAVHQYLTGKLIVPGRDVYPVVTNPTESAYDEAQKAANRRFNEVYTALVDSLGTMFASSAPSPFGVPTDLMGELSHLAAALRKTGPVKGSNELPGPTFEYLGKQSR